MNENALKWKEHYEKMTNDPEYKKEYLAKIAKEELEEVNNRLNKIDKFVSADDVPRLPIVGDRPGTITQKKWDNFYLPKLIEKGAIPKHELKNNTWYYGNFRNSNFGKWDAELERFGHWRMKFGWMWDTCDHFQDDRGFAIFVPIREATVEEIQEQEYISNNIDTIGRRAIEPQLLKEKEEQLKKK